MAGWVRVYGHPTGPWFLARMRRMRTQFEVNRLPITRPAGLLASMHAEAGEDRIGLPRWAT